MRSGLLRFFRRLVASSLPVAICLTGATAQAAPVDLSLWQNEGNGNWVLASDNLSVEQTVNGNPTVFFAPADSPSGTSLNGTITVKNPSSDDDFIGFVIGYQPGNLSNPSPSPQYILIDWWSGALTGASCGTPGLAISLVTKTWTDAGNSGFWCHDSTDGVAELSRATNLGATPWTPGTSYTFRIDYTSSKIDVYVNDVLEISITGTFPEGRFGFYNYSQENVTYSGIKQVDINPQPQAIPLNQTTWMLVLGLGLFMLYGIQRRSEQV